MIRLIRVPFTALALLALPAFCPAQQSSPRPATPADTMAVRQAVLDYVEGFYEGDSTRLIRSLHPEIAKYGFWRQRDSTSFHGEAMPWSEVMSYARQVKASGRRPSFTAPKEITLFEVQDHTASAKLRASWGTDYLLLGNFDGRWMVTHVLWQSVPKARP